MEERFVERFLLLVVCVLALCGSFPGGAGAANEVDFSICWTEKTSDLT